MDWFEDETFWQTVYPYMFPEQRIAAAPEEVRQLLALTGFQGQTILDLCCGPGRHSVDLAKRGYQVTGVDRTQFLLDRARERAAHAGANVEWVRQDMREFVRPASFDLALSLFTSLGYFETSAEERRVLRNVLSSLKSGAMFVVDMASKERLAQIWMPTGSQTFPDGTVLFERREVYDDWSRVRQEWTLVKNGHAQSFSFTHSVYSGRELKTELLETGFGEVRLYGDLEGAPFAPGASRLIAVARKI